MTWVHDLNPVIFEFAGLSVRWYGMMYVVAFLVASKLFNILSRQGFFQLTLKEVETFCTTMLVGMLLGARLTYVFIYNWDYHQSHPWEILSVWRGGLSFHGALAGFAAVIAFWVRKKRLPFYQFSDALALAGGVGVFFGRIGNFINGELFGRVTAGGWGVIFPHGGPYPRHPSQLYEALLEGFMVFLVVWLVKGRVRFYGAITAAYMVSYGVFRYCVEFFREADPQMGYYFAGTTTMGQILCLLMVVVGVIFYLHGRGLGHPIQSSS